MFTLRYTAETPIHVRKHAPTVAKFRTHAEAEAYRIEQDNAELLEVVKR